MMKPKTHHRNKVIKILSFPLRALSKARDLYVKSMNNYADRIHYGSGLEPGWGSTGYPIPRSFSTGSMRSSQEEDLKELVRAASTNSLGKRLDLGDSNLNPPPRPSATRVARSASVGMAKIEEDKACDDFGDGEIVRGKNGKGKLGLFPRSKSYAVSVPSGI